MYSDKEHSLNIINHMVRQEMQTQSWTWFLRVPTYSNLADPASRLEHDVMRNDYRAERVLVDIPFSLSTG